MTKAIVLASGSTIRSEMLRRAGVPHSVRPARVDEDSVRAALRAESAPPRDVADALAETKARKVAAAAPHDLVLGCDQVLAIDGDILAKPESRAEAADQLRRLRNTRHQLLSAAVLYEDAAPVWRHVGVARLHMRDFSDAFLEAYLDRNWPEVQSSVGAYRIEEEGVRLFSRVEGDHFTIMGLPLMELLNHLTLRGVLPS